MLEVDSYEIDVAVQIVAVGSKFEFFVEFRNRLQADPQLVHDYNALKKSFEGLSPDQYRAAKSQFMERVFLNQSRH